MESPELAQLLNNTIEDNRHYYAFDEISALRDQLSKDNTIIDVVDLGAGSKGRKQNQKKVKDIAKSAMSGKMKSEFIFRLIQYIQPRNVLEFGTSLGLSAFCMSLACPNAKITTIEGCPNTHSFAKSILKNNKNVHLINSSFDAYLDNYSNSSEKIDLLFIDGNHAYAPTMKYTEMVQPLLSDNSIVLYDDIYWSSGMTRAWKEVVHEGPYDATIDVFQFGIAIKNKKLTSTNQTVIPTKYKPWRRAKAVK